MAANHIFVASRICSFINMTSGETTNVKMIGSDHAGEHPFHHQRSKLINPAFAKSSQKKKAKTSFPVRNSVGTYSCSCLLVVVGSISALTAFIAVVTNSNVSAHCFGICQYDVENT